jgi:hypothetical protein
MELWQEAERCDKTSSCDSRKPMQLAAEFLVFFNELGKRNHTNSRNYTSQLLSARQSRIDLNRRFSNSQAFTQEAEAVESARASLPGS